MIQVFEVKKIKIENNRNEGDAGAICTFAFKNVLLFKCIWKSIPNTHETFHKFTPIVTVDEIPDLAVRWNMWIKQTRWDVLRIKQT